MTTKPSTPNITVRGGLINVPALTSPTQTPRHQPNTPQNKKTTKVKADHKPYFPQPEEVAKISAEISKPVPTDEVTEELE